MKKNVLLRVLMFLLIISIFSSVCFGLITDDIPGWWDDNESNYVHFYDFEDLNTTSIFDDGQDFSGSDWACVSASGVTNILRTATALVETDMTFALKFNMSNESNFFYNQLSFTTDWGIEQNIYRGYYQNSVYEEMWDGTGLGNHPINVINESEDTIAYWYYNGSLGNSSHWFNTTPSFNFGVNRSNDTSQFYGLRGITGNTKYCLDWFVIINGRNFSSLTPPPVNKFDIHVYDEYGNSILQNVSANILSSNNSYIKTSDNGNITFFNLPIGNYSILINSSFPVSYTSRYYSIVIPSSTNVSINAFLNTGSTVLFTYYDISSNELLENVDVTMYKLIGDTWEVVENRKTDVTGRTQFSYDPNTQYRFYSSIVGYEDKIFTLEQILFSSYDVKLTATIEDVEEFSDVNVNFAPTTFYVGRIHNFSFFISSANGLLSNYGFNVSYPCDTSSFSGTNNYGTLVYQNFTINCGNFYDMVNVTYYYDVSTGGERREFSFQYPLIINFSANNTFLGLQDNLYGLGDFERILIVVLVALMVGGAAVLVAGDIVGLSFALFILAVFTATGFVSIYFTILPFIIGIIYLMGRIG